MRFLRSLIFTALVVVSASGIADETSLSGRILDEASQPVADAQLELIGSVIHSTTTNEIGEYAFPRDVRPGKYMLTIESTRCVGLTHSDERPMVIIGEKPIKRDFTLKHACQFRIRIEDEEGNPVSGRLYYRVASQQGRTQSKSHSGKRGSTILGSIRPHSGDHLIGFRSNSHAPAQLLVKTNKPGEIIQRTITVVKGKSAKATVLCSDGLSASPWKLIAKPKWWIFGDSFSSLPIGNDGTVQLNNLVDGEYNLAIEMKVADQMSWRPSRPTSI